jgi:hypothetical protein
METDIESQIPKTSNQIPCNEKRLQRYKKVWTDKMLLNYKMVEEVNLQLIICRLTTKLKNLLKHVQFVVQSAVGCFEAEQTLT